MRYPILFVCLLMISCTIKPSQEEKSRVIEFTYGGFGDTIYATLEGYVRSQATKTPFDSMPPLCYRRILDRKYGKDHAEQL